MEPVNEERFRAVLGRFASGVTVMTTVAPDGAPHGMTANAISSVSLDPLLVLVCVERGTIMADLVARSGCFALSILRADQRPLSDHFAAADRPAGHEMFAGLTTSTGATGAPIVEPNHAWVDCSVWATYDGGDHVIVVGEVQALDIGSGEDALGYHRSGYTAVRGEPAAWAEAAAEGEL